MLTYVKVVNVNNRKSQLIQRSFSHKVDLCHRLRPLLSNINCHRHHIDLLEGTERSHVLNLASTHREVASVEVESVAFATEVVGIEVGGC